MHHQDTCMIEYEHGRLGEDVMAIGGHYTLLREVRLTFNADEIMYLTGQAVFDTTCCGSGGYGYAMVLGSIVDWKTDQSPKGNSVSYFKPIKDPFLKSKLSKIIMEKDAVTQVHFR